MNLAGPTALFCASIVMGAAPADVTVRTRTTSAGGGGSIETLTLQTSGRLHRHESRTELPGGRVVSSITQILDCDQRRVFLLNDLARLYTAGPVPTLPVRRPMLAVRRSMADTRPVVETRTIDAVDTGERRVFGPLTARHVITTTTVERRGAAPTVVNVRDGWYVDAPVGGCDDPPAATASMLIAGSAAGRVDVRWRGTAKTGIPLEEQDRVTDGDVVLTRQTALVEVSAAPIPRATFAVPDGYRPAVPLPFGGYDLTRPDTVVNRVSVWWNTAAAYVASFWR